MEYTLHRAMYVLDYWWYLWHAVYLMVMKTVLQMQYSEIREEYCVCNGG